MSIKTAPKNRLISAASLVELVNSPKATVYTMTSLSSWPRAVDVRSGVGRPAKLYRERDVLAWLDRERPDLARTYRLNTGDHARRVGGAA